jgi:N-acetylgalactosamine-6-sulfatase
MKLAALALACALLTSLESLRASPPSAKPNIIFILADDSGFADFGCYGHPYARTPNIDQLAADGTRFTQFYATGVTCCPARTGLMTSWLPARYGTYPANGGFANHVTITELLHQNGYATGHFGKWHIGPEAKNGTYGIDVVGADAEEGVKKNRTNSQGGRDAHIYDEAIKFMEQHKAGPFYMNVWSHISHHTIAPPQRYVDRFKDVVVDESKFSAVMREKFAICKARGGDVSEHMRRYLADLNSMDEDIGRLLKRLDELGLRDNTIVVFNSDQGPADIRASAENDPDKKKKRAKPKVGGSDAEYARLDAMGYSGEFRGGKHGMFEGGVRVPWIVRWPGHVPAKQVDEQSVLSGADWLPTLCAITGIKINPDDYDGEDTSAAWFGQGDHVRMKPLLWKTSAVGSESGIREKQWKLIHPTRKKAGEIELYEITTDPGETHNVAAQHPDVVKRLSTKVEAWVATLPKAYIKTDDKDR